MWEYGYWNIKKRGYTREYAGVVFACTEVLARRRRKKEQEERLSKYKDENKDSIKSNDDAVKILTSIDNLFLNKKIDKKQALKKLSKIISKDYNEIILKNISQRTA